MANTIKIKRGSGSDPSASDMVLGEPVLRTDTAELFFKKDDGSVAKVSGGGGGPDFKYLELRNAANDGAASYPGNDFTLVSAGTTTAVIPTAANTLMVVVSGVIQKPNAGTSTSGITGFIIDGSRLKWATNIPAAPDFIIYQESGGIGEPSDNTVTSAKIVDGSIVNADVNASAAIDVSKLSGVLPLAGGTLTGNLTISNTGPKVIFVDTDNNSDFRMKVQSGSFVIEDTTNNNDDRFTIASDGTVNVLNNLDVGAGLDVTGAITSTGNLTITNTAPALVLVDSDHNSDFNIQASGGLLNFNDSTNSATRISIASDGTVDVNGNLDCNSGIDVTGAITGTGDVTITKASPILRLADTTDPQTTNGSIGKIEFYGNDGSSGGADVRSFIQTISTNSVGNAHALIVGLGESNAAPTEKLRILGDGKVGIGVTPSTTLHLDSGGTPTTIQIDSDTESSIDFNDHGGSAKRYKVGTNLSSNDGQFEIKDMTANAERLRIDTSGNVGIGITPNEKLVVNGNSSVTGALFITSNTSVPSAGAFIYRPASNTLALGSNSAERLRIDSSGRVGIGTTSPATDIHTVSSSDHIITHQSTTSGADIRMNFRDSGNTDQGGIHYLFNGNSLKFITGTSERMRLDNAGNVGIGTTSPAAEIHVEASTPEIRIKSTNANVSQGTEIGRLAIHTSDPTTPSGVGEVFKITSYSAQGNGADYGTKLINRAGSNSGESIISLGQDAVGAITFYTNTSGSGVERLRILPNGNIGIGTASPTGKFAVSDGTTEGEINPSGGICYIGTRSNHPVTLLTNATGRMTIDTSGRLVVGAASARNSFAWTTSAGIQSEGAYNRGSISSTNNENNGNACAYVSAKIRGTGAVSPDDIAGSHVFEGYDGGAFRRIARIDGTVDGSVGSNSISGRLVFWTRSGSSAEAERMRITPNGQILMGTTSANSVNAVLAISGDGVPSYYANPAGLAVKVSNSNDAHCSEFFQGRYNKRVMTQSHSHTGGATFTVFEQGDSDVGSITGNGSNASFNTSSDYRLKQNIINLSDGITRLKQLIPRKFSWVLDSTNTLVDGFIAHEVQTVIPEAVTGEKDAVEENGSVSPQQMDYSKLTPLLTAALQEVIAKIEILETKVAALEAG